MKASNLNRDYNPAMLETHQRMAARMNTVSQQEADAAKAGNYIPLGKSHTMKLHSHEQVYSSADDPNLAVIFTTLPQCNSITEVVDGKTELVLHVPQMKQAIMNTPGFPQSVPIPPSPRSYSIVKIPSKGLGMVATRDIPFGELIMAERAMLIACRGVAVASVDGPLSQEQKMQASLDGVEKYLQFAIERMESDPATKKYATAYKNLCNSHLHDGSGPLMGIFRTNCFGVTLPLDDKNIHTAVFDKLSRINHSCSPNSFRSWNTASLSMQLYASRDIKKGEEITTWYADLMESSSQRRSFLARYSIDCQCRACTDPISDRNRINVSYITDSSVPQIIAWARTPTLPDNLLLKPALEMLSVIEEERLETDWAYARVLHQLVLIYFVLGETAEAKRYHRRWRIFLSYL